MTTREDLPFGQPLWDREPLRGEPDRPSGSLMYPDVAETAVERYRRQVYERRHGLPPSPPMNNYEARMSAIRTHAELSAHLQRQNAVLANTRDQIVITALYKNPLNIPLWGDLRLSDGVGITAPFMWGRMKADAARRQGEMEAALYERAGYMSPALREQTRAEANTATRDRYVSSYETRQQIEATTRPMYSGAEQIAFAELYGYGASAQPLTIEAIELTRPSGEQPGDGGAMTTEWHRYSRDLQAVIAAEQFGLQAYRDARGRVTFYDDLVQRFVSPEDMERNLIGGFDPLYKVNQRNRLGAGNIIPDPTPAAPRGIDPAILRRAPSTRPVRETVFDRVREAASQPSRDRVWTGASYYEGDQWSMFAGMSAGDKMQIQQRLVASGYLDPRNMVAGVWDYASAQAASHLMADANGNGVTWPEMMAEREAAMPPPDGGGGGGGGGGGLRINPFVAPAYIAPDYDTLKQGVRQAFDSILGRNVMDHELKLLADSMGADYRLAYEAEVKAARDEYDRQVAAIRSGARYAGDGSTIQGVNPMDSLMEQMLERYAPEVERTEQIHERAYNANLVMQAMGVLDRSVG